MSKKQHIHMYVVPLTPERPLVKNLLLEVLVKNSGDTVAVVKITLDGLEVWRHGKKITALKTFREVFELAEKGGW